MLQNGGLYRGSYHCIQSGAVSAARRDSYRLDLAHLLFYLASVCTSGFGAKHLRFGDTRNIMIYC
jgi:hypothetical protein